ncbi:MAG: hypothetical protein ACRC8J_05325 [Phocaeicola sp.]
MESLEVSQFVYEAYLHYNNNNKEIADSFVTNDTSKPLVEELKLHISLENKALGVAF